MMKILFKLITLSCFTLFLACGGGETKKDDAAKKDEKVVEEQKASKDNYVMNIKITYKSKTDGDFSVIYGGLKMDNNQKGSFTVTDKLAKTENAAVKDFKMFGDYIPGVVQLKLDRKNLQEIQIEKILLSYNQKHILVKGNELDTYFNINKYVDYNKEQGVLKTKKVNGNLAPNIILKKKNINNLFELQ